MGGGLMQLVAYGAQDVYLTGNPQITFWKVTYRRHTNFAMESIEQTFNGQADFGRRVQCTISRNGDLAYRTYLQVTLPEINQSDNAANESVFARWLDCPGEQMISMVEVEIGGQRIDRQYGDWMHIWNQLTLTSEQEAGYHKMIGQTSQLTYLTDPQFADVATACGSADVPEAVCAPRSALPETTLYVPLQFWFCRNPGLALPLIALQYHEVKINIEVRPLDECLFAVSSVGAGATGTVKVTNAYAKSLVAASLYVDYVFLDTDERRRMAQNPHEYLIEQLQFTGDESIGSSSNKVKLNFNHPCKEIIWVVQPDMHVAYCDSFLDGRLMHRALGAQPFNYTDAVDALPDSILAYGSQAQSRGASSVIDTSGLFNDTLSSDALFNGSIVRVTLTIASATTVAVVHGDTITQAGGATGTLVSDAPIGATELVIDMPLSGYLATPFTNSSATLTATVAGLFATTATTQTVVTSPDAATLGASGTAGAINGSVSNGLTDAGVFVLAETALNMHCWGENPVVTAKLQLNGQDRFSEREGTYFDLVQPYQHHTRNPDTGINVYSFALRPEEHQPSGTCNFSRIDNATLQLVVSAAAIGGTQTAKVRVYATNYNVLRVMSGMGGLAYSN